MRIIHILLGKANPNTMNGVNKVVHNLATEQHKSGHAVEVWGITATPNKISHEHTYTLNLFESRKVRFLLSNPLKDALDALAGTSTLVHLHSVLIPELFSVSRRLKFNNVPWVLSPHSGYNKNVLLKNKTLKSIYIALFERRLVSGARKVHAIGATEIVEIKSLDPLADVVLIPNGQSFDGVAFTEVETVSPKERPVFGFCGRLARNHKGLDLMLEGFADYKKQGGLGELWLIGDGPDKNLLISLAKNLEISASTLFLGAMFGDEKLSTLNKMDVFVHSSRWDVIPTATLEVSALGIPLLISEATNMGAYVRQYGNGLVLPENTPFHITTAMIEFEKMINSGDIKVMGEKSVHMIEGDLNWPVISKNVVASLYAQNRHSS